MLFLQLDQQAAVLDAQPVDAVGERLPEALPAAELTH